jgi:hypothetical protein
MQTRKFAAIASSLVVAFLFFSFSAMADWREVRLVYEPADVANCEFIAQVENRFSGGNQNQAQKRMLGQAAKRGATHVLLRPAAREGKEWVKALFTGYSSMGEAYKCPPNQASK